jgi:hypothetical protein
MTGDIVDSGRELSYLHVDLAGRYDNPMPESTISLQSGTKKFGYRGIGPKIYDTC